MRLKRLAALVLSGVLCVSALVGCGAKPEDTIATLGEEKVSYGVANFMMKYQKASVDDMYALYATYYGVDSMWDQDVSGNGSTLEQDFKDSAMELLHEMYTVKLHMSEYNVEITDEEQAAMEEAAKAFMAANTEAALEEFGATEDIIIEVLTLYSIQAKMYDAIAATADHEVSDEEANMRGYSMIAIGIDGEYNDSYEWVDYTEDEITEIKNLALQMDLDLNVKTMEEVAEENGYEVTADAYENEDTSLDAELLVAMDALKEGEVSDMIETEDTIYFVRIDADTDEEATEAHRQEIIEDREYAMYEEVVTGWQENDGWTVDEAMVNKIDFHNLLTLETEATEEETEYSDEEATESTEEDDVQETIDGTESE